jgi:hypothetical protein
MNATSKGDDWRLRDQEKYLMGASLVHRSYRRYAKNPEWDHDHCAFCWAKFMVEDYPDVLHEGYATADDYHWICDQCFRDFRERFQWQLIPDTRQRT